MPKLNAREIRDEPNIIHYKSNYKEWYRDNQRS